MASSRDRSRSPIRSLYPVTNALAYVAFGIVSDHERANVLDNAETIVQHQRATIRFLTRRLDETCQELRETREANFEAQYELVEDREFLRSRIRALETEVAELRARTEPQ